MPSMGIEQETMLKNDSPLNNPIEPSRCPWRVRRGIPDNIGHHYPQTRKKPISITSTTTPPIFIESIRVVGGLVKPRTAIVTQEQHLYMMAQYQAHAENMARYIEALGKQQQQVTKSDQHQQD